LARAAPNQEDSPSQVVRAALSLSFVGSSVCVVLVTQDGQALQYADARVIRRDDEVVASSSRHLPSFFSLVNEDCLFLLHEESG